MNAELRTKIQEAQREKGFSVEGFSRRDFGMMLIICQEVLLDDGLLETVNPLSKFRGDPLELEILANKINDFLE